MPVIPTTTLAPAATPSFSSGVSLTPIQTSFGAAVKGVKASLECMIECLPFSLTTDQAYEAIGEGSLEKILKRAGYDSDYVVTSEMCFKNIQKLEEHKMDGINTLDDKSYTGLQINAAVKQRDIADCIGNQRMVDSANTEIERMANALERTHTDLDGTHHDYGLHLEMKDGKLIKTIGNKKFEMRSNPLDRNAPYSLKTHKEL